MQKFLGMTHWMKFIPTTITDETFAIKHKNASNSPQRQFVDLQCIYFVLQKGANKYHKLGANKPEFIRKNANRMYLGLLGLYVILGLTPKLYDLKHGDECEHNAPSMLLNPVHSAPSHACNVSQQLCRGGLPQNGVHLTRNPTVPETI